MTLSNPANTFTGNISFGIGSTLAIPADGSMGNVANGLNFSSGGVNAGTVKMLAAFDSARAITLSGGGVGQIDTNGFNSTFSGAIGNSAATGTAQFRKLGAGKLTLTGAGSALGLAGFRVDGGTLEIGTGATITSGNSTAHGVSAEALLRVNGGTLGSGNFVVGLGTGTGIFTLDSGTYNNGAEFIVGWTGDGVFNMNGGLANLTQLSLTNAQPFTSTINLNGGEVSLISFNARANLVTPATATINFNGTTVTSESDEPDFIETNTTTVITANVQAGGALFNTATFNVTIKQPLIHDAALGATPDGGLTKLGLGTLTLDAANTYTGETKVSAGVLATTGNSIVNSGKLTIDGGKVGPTGEETVGTLFFGSTQQIAGIWGSSASTALPAFQNDTRFSGTGTVKVNSGPSGASFALWAAAFSSPALSNTAATADPDGDGLANSVEYVIGGDPRVSSQVGRPTATASAGNLTFTFSRVDSSETPDTTLKVQASSDLVDWTTLPSYTIGATTGTSSVGVVVSENAGAADTVTITIPGAAKRFARLSVVVTP